MSGALRILAAAFDVDSATAATKIKQLDTGLTKVRGTLSTVASSLVGAFSIGAFKHFIEGQIELGSRINDTAEKLGVTTDALQQFQFAAGLSGVGAEQAGTALQFLNKNLGAAIAGGAEQAKVFQQMGVDLDGVKNGSKSAADLLPQLAKKFEETGSDAERTNLAMSLFGKQGASLIPLLKKGSAELASLNEEFYALGGGIDENAIHMMDQAGDEVDKFKFALTGLKARIAVAVLPAVTNFAKHLQKIIVYAIKLTKETNIVKEGLAVLGVVGAAAGLKMAIGWGKFFGLMPKNAGLIRSMLGMGWIGLIIGLALAFEDLWTGINGGESVIRKWLENANGVEATNQLFDQLKAISDQIGTSFQNMLPAVSQLLDMCAKIVLSPYFIATIEGVVRLLGSMVALLVGAARAAGNVLTGDFKGAGKAVDEAGDAVFGPKGFMGPEAFKPYAPAAPRVAPAVYDPSSDPSSPYFYGRQGQATQVTANTRNTFNINGAQDPRAIAREVAKLQEQELQQAAGSLAIGAGED